MATLVSPGVSVSVTDESFFVPAAASTVPLFLIATAEEKTQPNGVSVALGTKEHGVVRTITSLTQSIATYGVPRFLETLGGEALHGDARNEYGLFAVNQYLGVGNRCYVVRANVNLNDDRDVILNMWLKRMTDAATALEVVATNFINEFNAANSYVAGHANYKETITRTELMSLAEDVLADVYDAYNFSSALFSQDFEANHVTPLDVYDNAFTSVVGSFPGLEGAAIAWEAGNTGTFLGKEDQWTPAEASTFLTDLADDYAFTTQFLSYTSLGANDASRRSAIVTALQAAANSPELRSEAYEFNLIMCPGYYEVVDEMVALATDIHEEALVIADTPMNMDADEVAAWAVDSGRGRQYNNSAAYYYSHGLASNLDGKDVLCAASGIMARVITVSDNNSQIWFAPAGANRGVVTGVSQMGHFKGVAGTPTQFVESVLALGQRDNLYKDGTNINPITFLPGRGIIVMGQKTSASVTSALDRVNVMRLLAYIRRQLRKSTFAFVFEPNDQLTRDNLKAMVDGFLNDIVIKRGLYDYATVCDDSNNTPDRIDRSEMYIDIALKPVKAAEFIYVPIRVLSTGAEL